MSVQTQISNEKQDETEMDISRKNGDDTEALSNNKVDVEIEPDVKSNDVILQICSCSIVLNCFSGNRLGTSK